MANHTARSAQPVPIAKVQPEPPKLRWATIAKVGDFSYCLATMVTQGQKIIEQHTEKPDARHIVEAQFQVWAALNILDRGES